VVRGFNPRWFGDPGGRLTELLNDGNLSRLSEEFDKGIRRV
jgi:hypothetical protein